MCGIDIWFGYGMIEVVFIVMVKWVDGFVGNGEFLEYCELCFVDGWIFIVGKMLV